MAAVSLSANAYTGEHNRLPEMQAQDRANQGQVPDLRTKGQKEMSNRDRNIIDTLREGNQTLRNELNDAKARIAYLEEQVNRATMLAYSERANELAECYLADWTELRTELSTYQRMWTHVVKERDALREQAARLAEAARSMVDHRTMDQYIEAYKDLRTALAAWESRPR